MEKMLQIKDVKNILGCSLPMAYDIIKCHDFPKIRIGRRFFIPKEAFEKWVNNYTGKEYKIK
jgi:excisionase family DNA binding protein